MEVHVKPKFNLRLARIFQPAVFDLMKSIVMLAIDRSLRAVFTLKTVELC